MNPPSSSAASPDPEDVLLSDKKEIVCCLPSARSDERPVKRVRSGKRAESDQLKVWPGLPRGVKFDPSDEDFLWHLLAKVGKGEAVPHPLISEYIISLDEDDSLGHTHPQRLAGVKQDGSVSYFFHRRFTSSNSICWHQFGKTIPVLVDGVHQGSKKIMILDVRNDEKLETTNWVMHQYHVGSGEDAEGDFVASKVFFNQKSRQNDKKAQDLNMEISHAGTYNQDVNQEMIHVDGTKLSNFFPTNFVPEVKVKSLEEICAMDAAAEITHCDKIQLVDSTPVTVPVEMKSEFSGVVGGDSSNANCTSSHHTSVPDREHWSPDGTKLSSSKILDSGSSVLSAHSCMLSQLPQGAGDCQDKGSLVDNLFGEEAHPNSVHLKALSKLQNANCSVKVEFEPLESDQQMCKNPLPRAEVKEEFHDRPTSDTLDHIPLKQRIEKAFLDSISNFNCGDKIEGSEKIVGRTSRCRSQTSNPNTTGVSLRKRRKRTATDSVETALEEDVPGLLQILLDKGITVEEMKLYGVTDSNEDNELLEISSSDDRFEELAAVISKLFSERSALFKLSSPRQTSGSKDIYYLTCLISLIEQARYLRFRNIPVEWGWCRDLQSFIFVFEKHNRIVLERPEYGYATYFFELVDSLSVDWQTKRLVTTMKLTSCSRSALMENRPLIVDKDLSEGEARVLERYGWTPNSGLGTMLNYCDRVVHDKQRKETYSDWRAKIAKLLMHGHDVGRAVSVNLPNKALKYESDDNPDFEIELGPPGFQDYNCNNIV